MSHVEPAIKHAMVALGALHEQRETIIKLVPSMLDDVTGNQELDRVCCTSAYSQSHDDQFGLSQYGKALSLLSKRMGSDSSVEVVLLAVILFVCVEFLRGDCQPAVAHFNSGMNIVLESLSANKTRTATGTMRRIREQLLPFLNRIELLSSLFGNEAAWEERSIEYLIYRIII